MVDRGSRIEVELADQREVVAGDAREFAAAGVQVLAVEGSAPEEFVERADRRVGRKSEDGLTAAVLAPGVEAGGLDAGSEEQLIAPVVGVAAEDHPVLRAQIAERAGVEEPRDLLGPLAGREAEMPIEDVQRPAPVRELEPRVERVAALAPADPQLEVSPLDDRDAREGGVAVGADGENVGLRPRRPWIVRGLRQHVIEEEIARARGAAIHLLQQDDVGLVVAQHLDHPLRIEASVLADAAVDVPGEEAQAHPGLYGAEGGANIAALQGR